MLNGYVSEDYARLEHSKWLTDLDRAAEARADHAATMPPKESTPLPADKF
jgi:hypothetical protein